MPATHLLVLLSLSSAAAFAVQGATSAPSVNGSVLISGVPTNTTNISFVKMSDSLGSLADASGCTDPGMTAVHNAIVSQGSITWTSLTPGTYILRALPSLQIAQDRIIVHSGYTLTSVVDPPTRYSVAGRQAILLSVANGYDSNNVVVRFSSSAQAVDVPGTVDALAGTIAANTPAYRTPATWLVGCSDPLAPVRSTVCAPDLPSDVSFSLDGGLTFSNTMPITFGFVRRLKLAFLYVGPITDFGWTYAYNKGRLSVERAFGGLVDSTTYFESLPEGEFSGQANTGATIATGTHVSNDTSNAYFPAFNVMKQMCEQDYDIVFTGSYGFMSQTFDVTNYSACHVAADGTSAHPTRFVHANVGGLSNNLMSSAFAKIYQMRYLTGLVAGDALAANNGSPYGTPRNSTCVGYIAAFPIAEVQRGINAFTLGCRARFPACTVKVVWTGTWHSVKVEGAAAHFFWNEERCDIITQHSDTNEPQQVFRTYGGSGVGYNSDMRETVGDSVLTAPMLDWGPVFTEFVTQGITDSWRENVQAWPGVAEGAVKLAPTFSPRVDPATVQDVERELATLRSATGDNAFKHTFCGPLKKRWAYQFANTTSGSGVRANSCFNPIWRRLDPPEQINMQHYRDIDGNPLPENRQEPLATDCLWGMNEPGEALKLEAYPQPFNESLVFSDFLVDGVELMSPKTTPWGDIHSETTHGLFPWTGCTGGDRFYFPPPDPVQPQVAADCASGSILQTSGSENVCVPCSPGTYEIGNVLCQPADSNSYVPTSSNNITGQLPCKAHSLVQVFFAVSATETVLQLGTGAVNTSECLCAADYYLNADDECAPCPNGATCHGAHFPPVALRGFGQLDTSTNIFKECPNYENCLSGGGAGCDCLGGTVNMRDMSVSKFTCNTANGYLEAEVRMNGTTVGNSSANVLCNSCSSDYAKQMLKCEKCEMEGGVYVLFFVLLSLLWFRFLRELITKYVSSMYTTTSFVQYLGMFSIFHITWRNGISDLLAGLSLFVLNFDYTHLQCAVTWTDLWLLQMLLPLLYPCVLVVALPSEFLLAKVRGQTWTLTNWLWSCVGPGLFYFNLYYYTGISSAMDMLNCADDGNGAEYVIAHPETVCWTGDHSGYAVMAALFLFVYLILLPLLFCFLLFSHLPRTGFESQYNLKTFGFLYERFLPEVWYWEIVETARKFVFVLVAKLQQRMDTFEATVIALFAVSLVFFAEVRARPFKSNFYDLLEESSTMTEVVVLLLGIFVLYRDNTEGLDLEWVEPVAWVFIISALSLALFAIVVDLNKLSKVSWMRRTRAAHGLRIDLAVFDLQFWDHLIPAFLTQADKEKLQVFKKLEEVLERRSSSLQAGGGSDETTTSASPKFLRRERSLRLSLRDLNDVMDCDEQIALSQLPPDVFDNYARGEQVSDSNKFMCVPGTFFFNERSLKRVLNILKSPTMEERAAFTAFFAALQQFELARREQLKEAGLITKLKMWLDKLGVRKNVVAKDALLREVLGISTPKADKKKASSERYSKTSAAVATASYTSSHEEGSKSAQRTSNA